MFWIVDRRERDACEIQPSALVLSARNLRTHPPGGVSLVRRMRTTNHVLINTAINSRTLICRTPVGSGLYRSGSLRRTGQPWEARSVLAKRHLKLNAELQPPRPAYEASVNASIYGERGTRRPIGRRQMLSAFGLIKSCRTSMISLAMCAGTRKRRCERQILDGPLRTIV